MKFTFLERRKKRELADEEWHISDIFHEYDIRGSYPEEINEEVFSVLATSVADVLKSDKIVLGRDSRNSSLSLTKALASSLLDYGIDVLDAGLITTPLASWLARKKVIDTLMVTASHNPKNENGLKIYSEKQGGIGLESGLGKIKDRSLSLLGKGEMPKKPDKKGSLKRKDFREDYKNYILKLIGKFNGSKLRIALDYSNGTVGTVLNGILDELKINYTTLNEEPNGDFPGHSPNPLEPETHKKIKWLIKNGRYNLGAIFDGDGDRIIFFNEKGEQIITPHAFSLLCSFYLPKSKTSKSIVKTASFSKVVDEVVRSLGGKIYTSPVGRTKLPPLMRKKDSLMGIERSGHYFFKEFFFRDCASLALLKMLKVLASSKEPISKLVEPFDKYTLLPEINIPYVEDTEEDVLKAVEAAFPEGKHKKIDGITVEHKDWWLNLRRSNTQDFWRLTLEGDNKEFLQKKKVGIENIVKSFPKVETKEEK